MWPLSLVEGNALGTLLISFAKTNFCNLVESPMTKITQNSISLAPQSKKLQNHLHRIPLIKGFPTISRVCPQFPLLILNHKIAQYYSSTIGLDITNLPKCTATHLGFSNSTRMQWGLSWFWRSPNIQNK
jgi:hypothetical protein